jgi:organic radical activating enzyme
LITAIRNKTGVFVITWIINNICNRACNYCPANLHNGGNHHYDWAHAEAFADLMISKHKNIHVVISGGEPTMSPWLPDLIKKFTDHGHTVGLTSNGVRTFRYYEELAPMLQYLCLSWHPDPEDVDFLAKAQAASQHCLTKVNLMMPADHWGRAIAMHKQLKSTNLTWDTVRVTKWHDESRGAVSRNYTPEQLKWFTLNNGQTATWDTNKQYPRQLKMPTPLSSTAITNQGEIKLNPIYLINTDQNLFQGWQCNQGLESLFLFYTGRIGLSNCGQNYDIGRIQELDKVQWPLTSQTCKMDRCHCVTDIYLSKHRPS